MSRHSVLCKTVLFASILAIVLSERAKADCTNSCCDGVPDPIPQVAQVEQENFKFWQSFMQNLVDAGADSAADSTVLKGVFNLDEGQLTWPIGPANDWLGFNSAVVTALTSPAGMSQAQEDAVGKYGLDFGLSMTAQAFAAGIVGVAGLSGVPAITVGVAAGVAANYASEALWRAKGEKLKINVGTKQ